MQFLWKIVRNAKKKSHIKQSKKKISRRQWRVEEQWNSGGFSNNIFRRGGK